MRGLRLSREPERTELTASLTRLAYGPADDPGAVTLWVCETAGHTWPGTRLPVGLRLWLGRTPFDVDATAGAAQVAVTARAS